MEDGTASWCGAAPVTCVEAPVTGATSATPAGNAVPNATAVNCAAAQCEADPEVPTGAPAAAATAAAFDGDDALPWLISLAATGGADSTHYGPAAQGTKRKQQPPHHYKQQVELQLGLATGAGGAREAQHALGKAAGLEVEHLSRSQAGEGPQLGSAELRRRAALTAVWKLCSGLLRLKQHGQQMTCPTLHPDVGVSSVGWGEPGAWYCQSSAQVG